MQSYVIRRTFEAAKHPKGSPERAKLNEDAATSEYFTGSPYLAVYEIAGRKSNKAFKTKAEALAYIS